jgi:hypothetical protein
MTLRIEKLARQHAVEHFDCGKKLLNRFLIRFSRGNQQAQASKTYLSLSDIRSSVFISLWLVKWLMKQRRASGKPFNPSIQAIKISVTPRFLSSVMTLSQNYLHPQIATKPR